MCHGVRHERDEPVPDPRRGLGLEPGGLEVDVLASDPLAFTLITGVEIVFGELTPKWIALERAEGTALWLVRPLELFMRTLWPFIRVVHGTAQAVIKASETRHGDRGKRMRQA